MPLSPEHEHARLPDHPPVRVDIWSDFVCPYCLIGALRLDQLAEKQPIEPIWHAFMLRPPGSPGMTAEKRAMIEAYTPKISAQIRDEFGLDVRRGPIGAQTFAAIADRLHDLDDAARARLGFTRGIPAETTVWRLLTRLDADLLATVLARWLRTRARPIVPPQRRARRIVIAIDGKTMRGARRTDGTRVHLLSGLDTSTGIVLAVTWGGHEHPWGSWQVLGALAVAALGVVALVAAERRAAAPVLPLDLFRNRSVVLSMVVMATGMGAVLMSAVNYVPAFLELVQGRSASSSGLLALPLLLPAIATAALVGLWTTRLSRFRPAMVLGTTVLVVACVLLARMGVGTPAAATTRLTAVETFNV